MTPGLSAVGTGNVVPVTPLLLTTSALAKVALIAPSAKAAGSRQRSRGDDDRPRGARPQAQRGTGRTGVAVVVGAGGGSTGGGGIAGGSPMTTTPIVEGSTVGVGGGV